LLQLLQVIRILGRRACGAFTFGSVRVQELIFDQINDALLSEYVVFSDPHTFSIEFSIAGKIV
jgi:hypothetical protein